MDDEKKKLVMTVVSICCLVIAGIIAYTTMGGGGAVSAADSEMWLLCRNPECKSTYNISLGEYRNLTDPEDMMIMMPGQGPIPVECKECSEKSAFMAEKCEPCDFVFISNPQSQDYPDRCPKCGRSEIEEAYQN